MVAPEAILSQLLGKRADWALAISAIGPMIVPFDALADCDGWLLDPGSYESCAVWDDPESSTDQRALRGLLVACDYAIRRGGKTSEEIAMIIRRESPVAFISADNIKPDIRTLITSLDLVGKESPARRRRSIGHRLAAPLRSDPAISFEERREDDVWGDNGLSSLRVHPCGKLDGVTISREPSERWAIDIGLPNDVQWNQLPEIEANIAEMPSFQGGLSSAFNGSSIEVSWATPTVPDPQAIGTSIHAWTRALFDLELVDVRIVFAIGPGEAPILTGMRSRAAAFRLYRDSVIDGRADPDLFQENE